MKSGTEFGQSFAKLVYAGNKKIRYTLTLDIIF